MPEVVPPKAAVRGAAPPAWNSRSRGVPSRQLLALAGRGFTRFLERTAERAAPDGTDADRS